MTTISTPLDRDAASHPGTAATASARRSRLRELVAGAAAFDGGTGLACLFAAGPIGSWLGLSAATIRETGAVFLLAAVVGAGTALRSRLDTRPIELANLAFAAWCVAVMVADSPDAAGLALLAVSTVASAGTASVEHRLAAAA